MISERAMNLANALINDGLDYNARVECIRGGNPFIIARRFVTWTMDYGIMLNLKGLETDSYTPQDILDAAGMVIDHTTENVREWSFRK